MSLNLETTINLEQYFHLVLENLISLNNKLEILEIKINNIEPKKNIKVKINDSYNYENLDWESIIYYQQYLTLNQSSIPYM